MLDRVTPRNERIRVSQVSDDAEPECTAAQPFDMSRREVLNHKRERFGVAGGNHEMDLPMLGKRQGVDVAVYLGQEDCRDRRCRELPDIAGRDLDVQFSLADGVREQVYALNGQPSPERQRIRAARDPRLIDGGDEKNARPGESCDHEPLRESCQVPGVLSELPIYIYVFACLFAGGLICAGAWLFFDGWLGCAGTRLHLFAGCGLIVLGGALWLYTGFAAIGEGPFAWQGGVLDALVRLIQSEADFVEPILKSEPSDLPHLRQLEIGDASVKDDSRQRESFNDKLRVFEAALLSLAGFVAIYYGGWNLKFTDNALRGGISLLVGIILVAYGATLFLQRFPGPRLSGHGIAAWYLEKMAAADDHGIRRVSLSADVCEGVCISESRKQMKRQAAAALPPPGCGQLVNHGVVQGKYEDVRQPGPDCPDYSQFGSGAVGWFREKVHRPHDEFVQGGDVSRWEPPIISDRDGDRPVSLRIIGALDQHPCPERQLVRAACFFELGGGRFSGVGERLICQSDTVSQCLPLEDSRDYVGGRHAEQRPVRYAGVVPLPGSRRYSTENAIPGIEEHDADDSDDPIGRYLGYALGAAMMLTGLALICWVAVHAWVAVHHRNRNTKIHLDRD